MGIKIHQLPAAIANQIAAGEVIERPASVVKELLENCLDSGATVITIDIGYGGLNHIKISDNGCGIIEEDLPLAIAAHATSKIQKLDDLYAIESMGFRGEALASIASISKLTISSKPKEQAHAALMHMQGSSLSFQPCARNDGTTIEVCDLFFNAPVRKRFLKSEKLEYQAIEMVVKRFALSAPHIEITLKHNNKQCLLLPKAVDEHSKKTRIAKLLGQTFMREAIFLDVEHANMHLYGWVSGRAVQRSQNDRQWVYINQRMVRDKLINHALKQAYDGILHPGRFPSCLLYFSIAPSEVDVNVHPTKHEVRFVQPRLVHDFFTSQLSKALAHELEDTTAVVDSHSVTDHRLCEPLPVVEYKPRHSPNANIASGTWRNSRTIWSKPSVTAFEAEPSSTWVILNSGYCLIFIEEQPCIVDVLELHRIGLLEQLNQTPRPLASRPLLVPISYPLPQGLSPEDILQALQQLGIHSQCKADTIQILSLPIIMPYLDVGLLFDLIAEDVNNLLTDGIGLCLRAQVLDPSLLSQDERLALMQMLLSPKANSEPYFKPLTLENCRMFLNA